MVCEPINPVEEAKIQIDTNNIYIINNITSINPSLINTNSIITFWKWLSTPHFGSRKWLKCDVCRRKSYMTRDGYKHKWLDWYK